MVEISSKRAAGLLGIALGAGLGLIIGVLIGFAINEPTEELDVMAEYVRDQWYEDGGQYSPKNSAGRSSAEIIAMVSTDNIEKDFRELTDKPHVAATERDRELATIIESRMREAGMTNVEVSKMDVLLSRPDPDNPNLIRIYDSSHHVRFTSSYMEEPLDNVQGNQNFVHAFNAYTPAGDIYSSKGEGVVYVNYGRTEDFQKLTELGVNVSGCIALMRYGNITLSDKVAHATHSGISGVILYSDPEEVASAGQAEEDVYPHTHWLPGTGLRRESALDGYGDPLTPGWPSVGDAFRLSKEKTGLPTIPVQPIGYSDAKEIFMLLGGSDAPPEWQGALEGITYKMGPRFMPEFSDYRLRLTSNNREEIVESNNVIGMIEGDIEPDRYVLIGNHRDAWAYGAAGPSSGTAQLLETIRIVGDLRRRGWKPRRSLMFCSWGAHEYGLIGSTEWVETHIDKLKRRAVTYINTDNCACGQHVQLKSSPSLYKTLSMIADKVPGVLNPSKTLGLEWLNYTLYNHLKYEVSVEHTLPYGSDYAPFTFYAGIPSVDISFTRSLTEPKGRRYPTYHTGYDTYFAVTNISDPGFKAMQGCTRMSLLLLKCFSDSLVLPFDLSHFTKLMQTAILQFTASNMTTKITKIYPNYERLRMAMVDLAINSNTFTGAAQAIKTFKNALQIMRLNDVIMQFEKEFILPNGLPGRPFIKHGMFAPSKYDGDTPTVFPGLVDLLQGYEELGGVEKEEREEQIAKHISDLTIMMNRASNLLYYPVDLKQGSFDTNR